MFLHTAYTPAGVPAVYERRLAGLGDDMGIDDILNALPSVIQSGGNVAATVIRAINPSTVLPATYASPLAVGGGSTLLLIGAGILGFMLLSGKKRR